MFTALGHSVGYVSVNAAQNQHKKLIDDPIITIKLNNK
jgi:hypothetical protein